LCINHVVHFSCQAASPIPKQPIKKEKRKEKEKKHTLLTPNSLPCSNANHILYTQTRPAGVELDGVGIVTILNKQTGPEILLQKQYRPPIDKVVIEVPAGLIDAGETPEQCAVRELLEETGYVGVAEQISPVMYNGIISPFFFCVWLPRSSWRFFNWHVIVEYLYLTSS
jgi:8-oxo-dGTP pyrophosphatase MutT (NUDIX family)